MNWKIIITLALLLLLVIFTVQNYEVVEIQLLFWTLQTSRAIVIFVTLLIGIIVGWTLSYLLRDRL